MRCCVSVWGQALLPPRGNNKHFAFPSSLGASLLAPPLPFEINLGPPRLGWELHRGLPHYACLLCFACLLCLGGPWTGTWGRGARNCAFRACFRETAACRGWVVHGTFSFPCTSSSKHYKGGARCRVAPVKQGRKKYSNSGREGLPHMLALLCLLAMLRRPLKRHLWAGRTSGPGNVDFSLVL